MNRLKFILVLLLTITGINANAQRNNQVPANKNLQTNASANNTAAKYELKSNSGKIAITNGTKETIVSSNPNDLSPILQGNEVYYLRKPNGTGSSTESTIYVYDIIKNTTTDIIKPNVGATEYNAKNVVENIIMDKGNNKLYFSTSMINPRGYTEFLTWKYDVATKEMVAYKDGKIESIDPMGNQTIVFESADINGKFTSRSLISSDGQLQKVTPKVYTQTSSNK